MRKKIFFYFNSFLKKICWINLNWISLNKSKILENILFLECSKLFSVYINKTLYGLKILTLKALIMIDDISNCSSVFPEEIDRKRRNKFETFGSGCRSSDRNHKVQIAWTYSKDLKSVYIKAVACTVQKCRFWDTFNADLQQTTFVVGYSYPYRGN